LLKQYNYTFHPNFGYYSFLTKRQIEYRVALYEDFTLASCVANDVEIGQVYQITIDKISSEPAPFDACVSETIRNIVSAFFKNIQDALIYIYDDNDKKAYQRFYAFDRWYNNSKMTDSVTKLNNIIEFDNDEGFLKLHTSLMFHNDNNNVDNIRLAYDNLRNVMNGDKP
jgi:hypothetical protein